MSIDVRCHTNLNLHPCEEWPSELTCRPVVGDIIESSTGLELQVVRVAHSPHSKTGFLSFGKLLYLPAVVFGCRTSSYSESL